LNGIIEEQREENKKDKEYIVKL